MALGPLTVRMMEDIHVHQTILSVGGITAKGLFNSNLLLVETERAMMRCADEVVVVADHTKIGRQALAFLCELADVDTLIVDRGIDARNSGPWPKNQGVRLLVAGEANDGGVSMSITLDRGLVERLVREAIDKNAPASRRARRAEDWSSTSPPGTPTSRRKTSNASSARAISSRR